jgi:hypothetical protein
MNNWWLTQAGAVPTGPFAESVIVRKIATGETPRDSLVCVVGGDRWQTLEEIPAFAAVLAKPPRLRRFEETDEKTIVDDMPLAIQDDEDAPDERTEVNREAFRPKPRA